MATLGYQALADIGNLSLTHYLRGPAVAQTIQDRPLLNILKANQKTFGGAGGASKVIAENVQGAYMSDTPGFFQGFSQDDQMSFQQAGNTKQTSWNWYEQASNLIITETDLKIGGITVDDNMKDSKVSEATIDIVTPLMENHIADFMESWYRSKNLMYWLDGSQDAKQVPGILSIITDAAVSGTVGGLASGNGVRGSSATWWWYNRARVGNLAYQVGTGMNAVTSPTGPKITPSPTDQTLTRTLRAEVRQLRRFGGKPTIAICGSGFLDALDYEVQSKGTYTEEGFMKNGKLETGMAAISMKNLGTFEWDPTLDDLGLSKRCYIIDPTKITLRPMAGATDKLRSPTRPYNYYVFLKSITDTSALTCKMRSCHGVYEVV